jgi:hypothetical protein
MINILIDFIISAIFWFAVTLAAVSIVLIVYDVVITRSENRNKEDRRE